MKGNQSSSWEKLCNRCGLCCYSKTVEDDRVVYHMDHPCRDLDAEQSLCRVYDTRFSDNPECKKMTLFKAMFAPYLPPTCGYVQWAKKRGIRFARSLRIVYLNSSQ